MIRCLLTVVVLLAALPVRSEECQRFSIVGEVEGQNSFFHPIGMDLSFRMEPSHSAGFVFEIGPTRPRKDEWEQYIYVLNPPWRSKHITMIDASYGEKVQEAVAGPRAFWFLLNRADAPRAEAAVNDILWPQSETATDGALAVLGSLAMGSGVLHVVEADIVPTGAMSPEFDANDAFYGAVKRIRFRVEFTVPKTFRLADGLSGSPVTCPDPKAWSRQWSP